jgi:pimeloyl-ACP methyl ester carboxylesterase
VTRGKGLVVLLIVAMSLFGCQLQYQMLYYPSQEVPTAAALAAQGLVFWPKGPEGYRGFAARPNPERVRGTVLCFHGNAGTADQRAYYAAALTPLGYRVVLAEYPGYGKRPGPLGEASLVTDAREQARLAARTYGEPLLLLGESLGSGVAAAAASDRGLPIAGLLLITPWDSLRAVARTHYPWFPLGPFLKDRYDSGQNLQSFPGPVAIVAAQGDEIVPHRHAQALYEALPGTKKMWTIPQAGHNDWLYRISTPHWEEWLTFLNPR